MATHDIAWANGSIVIRVEDVARAIAVQDGLGEEMKDPVARELRMQEARDIMDRAFRYARDRRDRDVNVAS